ncbi:portal protein [Campylobacter fetus]|uniref:portal protein n=1 Tax=Campylobacter fetus TaxID=196 RepID=UPI00138DE96F|nr:phage head-tail adapter protein [Campylobacter fetus]
MNNDKIQYFNDLITRSKNGYEHYKPVFDKLIEAYMLCTNEQEAKYLFERNKSNIYIPKINAKAKRIMDALSETYFQNETFAKLDSFVNSNEKVIELWQKALDFYTAQLKLYDLFQPEFLKVSFIGTLVAKVYWNADKPEIEMLDIDKVFFDPDANNARDIRYVVNKLSMTKSDMDELIKAKIYANPENEIDESYPFERFELYDIYTKKGDKWYLSTIYRDNILRQELELKDGLPIIYGYALPQIKKLNEPSYVSAYGEPPLASILPLQEEINRTRNGLIDGMRMHLSPKLIIPKSSQISRLDIETPQKPIYASDPKGVGVIPAPNISSALTNVQIIENEMSESSGISPQQNGSSTPRKETATMSSIMANEGSVRLQGYIRTLNETWFEPIFERLAMLIWKYGDAMFFAGYARDDVMSFKADLNTGIGALNKEVQKRSLIEGGQLIGQHFQMCASMQDMDGAKRMVDAHEQLVAQLMPLFGIKDFDKYLEKKDGDELNRAISQNGAFSSVQGEDFGVKPTGDSGVFNEMDNGQIVHDERYGAQQ